MFDVERWNDEMDYVSSVVKAFDRLLPIIQAHAVLDDCQEAFQFASKLSDKYASWFRQLTVEYEDQMGVDRVG